MSAEQIHICTIISKNYLAHARVLTESFLKNNPNGKVYVLLVDEIENKFDPTKEKFTLFKLDEIGIENLEDFCFKYTILEQNTGTKAHFLKYLFERFGLKKLAYFDPDILFTNNLENLWKLLDKKSIILTPHLTEPITDNKKPSEFDILRSGSYNLGFIGLAYNETTRNFLNWWIPYLMEYGYSDVDKGLFTDQKWIELVPSLFDDVYIIRHPGYNVAYWNLMQRKVEISDDRINVNEKPMYFFHFSGFVPENLESVSKHQNRFVLNKIESVRPLFELYRDLLVENDYLDIKDWKCKYDYFDNGVKISVSARKVFVNAIKENKKFGNPFSTKNHNSFLKFLNENVDKKQPEITRLWYQIYHERKDIQEILPDPLGEDRESFVRWLEDSLKKEYNFDKMFYPSQILKDKNQIFNQNKSSDLQLKKMQIKKERESKLQFDQTGVNVSGYFKGEFGVAESARSFIAALESQKIPCVLNNLITNVHRNEDNTLKRFRSDNPYPINLIIINADQSDGFYNEVTPEYFKNKYNIALWAWELSDFPKKLISNQKYYDEIWVLSNFVAESLSKSLSIPVVKIPCPIIIDESKFVKDKPKFGVKDDEFMFLFIFDFYSIYQRKNPNAIIQAFDNAFDKGENAVLVLKSINGEKFQTEFKELKKLCEGKNIKIIDEHFDKDDLYSLIGSCDCYVSLHRSEGYGLTMAEAMFAKKPVIATNYSGNVDFMNINNSFPVKYKLIELETDYGPYKKGNHWAEPDIEHAKSLMQYVFENRKESQIIADKGSKFIKEVLNPLETGRIIKERFENITKSK